MELGPGESVVYPAPYVAEEKHPLIITTQRVVQFRRGGQEELPMAKINYLSRSKTRPFAVLAVLFILAGLPLVGYGAYLYWPVHGMPSFKDHPPPEGEEGLEDPGVIRLYAIAYAIGGAACLWLSVKLFRRKRFYIRCQAQAQRMRIDAKDSIQQTQILMTLQALQSVNRVNKK